MILRLQKSRLIWSALRNKTSITVANSNAAAASSGGGSRSYAASTGLKCNAGGGKKGGGLSQSVVFLAPNKDALKELFRLLPSVLSSVMPQVKSWSESMIDSPVSA